MLDTLKMLDIANAAYRPTARKCRQVSDQALADCIRRMSASGYKFNSATVEAVRDYMRGYGILLSGKVGTGKTLFFRKLNPSAIIIDMGDVMGWRQEDVYNSMEAYANFEIVLDDLGCGGSRARDYGREFDALLLILNIRDPSRCVCRTHFTTNLTNDELIEHFDARVVDRIYGMAKCHRMPDGESMREAVAFV